MKKIITATVLLILTLLCCSGCAQNVEFYSAKIYRAGIGSKETEKYVYIKSAEEMKSYYDVSVSTHSLDGETEPKKVFDSEQYNDAFFESKCLLLLYYASSHVYYPKFKSIMIQNGIINVTCSYYWVEGMLELAVLPTPTLVVIELDKEYADTEAKLILEKHS